MHTRLVPSMSFKPQRESQSTPPAFLTFLNYLGPHWRRGYPVPLGNVTDLNLRVQSEAKTGVAAAAAVYSLTGSSG